MSQLALYLFGPPRLERDGVPVHITRRKAMALLAYLAVTGQVHSRDALATMLWPENDQSSARAGLRRMLSVLNRTLGKGWLKTDRETAGLKPQNELAADQSLWLDVTAFQEKLAVCESHNHPPSETCPECIPVLEEAVALYPDDFMAGFSLKDCPAYDEWQFFQANELRRGFANALACLSTHYSKTAEYETAISHARRWLALDPLHEPAQRNLMSLYAQSGQQSAALRQYQICCQVLEEELGVEPSEETQALANSIRRGEMIQVPDSEEARKLEKPKTAVRTNLPAQTTPFIGRVTELAEIRARLKEKECRLLTLLGPGGSGKTRLAIEAVGTLLDDYQHGVFFINLAPLQSADLIPTTIATALKFSFQEQGAPEEQLLDYLHNKQMLLIPDNFEHLLEGVDFVNQIIHTAPAVKILATSRSRLMVTGEYLYEVWGMAYPEPAVSLETATREYSAIKLFESEASRMQADFKLNDDNLGSVIRVCSLLEGLPLGIVLAANWVTMLTPSKIAAEIARDLAFLDSELKDLPQRQRGMRAVFNHSWRLLSEDQRHVLAALSVFRGSFIGEAAHEVARASLRDLKGLTDQSFLRRTSNNRYEIHELLRECAAEKLAMDPSVEAEIRETHSNYYCQALAVWERKLQGPQQFVAKNEMVLEIDNIRAAWKWAVENLRFKRLLVGINGLCDFFSSIGQVLEGVNACQYLVERLKTTKAESVTRRDSQADARTAQANRQKLYLRALSWGTSLNTLMGNFKRARELADQCLSMLKTVELAGGDTRFEKARVYLVYPWLIENTQPGEARKYIEEALRLFKSLDEPGYVSGAYYALAMHADSTEDKIRFHEQQLATAREIGDLGGMTGGLNMLHWEAAHRFEFEKAEALLQEDLAISAELEDSENIVHLYASSAAHWCYQGRFDEARSLFRETLARYHDQVYTPGLAPVIHVLAALPEQYQGAYQAAHHQAQHALNVYGELKYFHTSNWSALAVQTLGCIALAERSYVEAEQRFRECPRPLEKMDIAMLHACQGYAARGLGQTSQAHVHLSQALSMAIEGTIYPPLLHALPCIALLYADQGEVERAVELYALASTFGWVANSKWFADVAGDEIEKVAAEMPPDVVEAAKARGRALDVWETAKELLVELEEMGWGDAG